MMPLPVSLLAAAAIGLDDLRHGDAEVLFHHDHLTTGDQPVVHVDVDRLADLAVELDDGAAARSEEHTSELQSLMRISYAVFCLKKKTKRNKPTRQPT